MNTYISDYFDSNPTAIPAANIKLPNGTIITRNNISQFVSIRMIYSAFIFMKEFKTQPPPESLQIFTGEKPPPEPSESNKIYHLNFEELKTICKKY
jgi:hypothetical protein